MSLIPTETSVRLEHKPESTKHIVFKMLTGLDLYGTTMLVWAIDHFGFDEEEKKPYVFLWAPETIYHEINDFLGTKIPKRNFDKLMAAITVVTTDLFFKKVGSFIELANILAGDDFQPDEFDPADSLECAWAVTEALLLSPPDDYDPEPFCDEIRHYISKVLQEEGYVKAPDVLGIAIDSDFSAKVQYNFADDPEMFQAINENQLAKTKEVSEIIEGGLRELFGQLTVLPLKEGSTEGLEQRLSQMIRSTHKGE